MGSNRGNALFLILIAVALFAALSYAITNSGRGGGGTDREQVALAASQMVQYAGQVATAVTRLRITGGCSDSQISFHYDRNGDGSLDTTGDDAAFYNPASGTDCYIFHPDGAGLTYQPPPESLMIPAADRVGGEGEYVFTGGLSFFGIGSMCQNSTECTDLAFTLGGLTLEACQAINRQLFDETQIFEHETWAWAPSQASADDYFKGTYQNWAATYTLAHPTTSYVTGASMGCFQRWMSSPARYTFFSILHAR